MANVVLKNIYKIYDGNVTAVSDFCLDIADREFIYDLSEKERDTWKSKDEWYYEGYVNAIPDATYLKDGEMFDGQTLRSSFQKAITPLDQHEQFIFLSPSLLINLYQIKILDLDHLYFDNDEVLYFPRKAHDTIEQRWKQALGIK